MLYFLKIAAALLLPPGIFILLLLCLALKQRHRRLGIAAGAGAVLLWLLSCSAGARILCVPLEQAHAPSAAQADVIVVLGGGALASAPDFGGQGSLLSTGAARLLTGARLARAQGMPLIVTGGQVYADSGSEAQISRRCLLQLGVDEAKIIAEPRARTTRENAQYAAQLCGERGCKKILLVTSALHMPRALQSFNKVCAQQGIAVAPYPCDYNFNAQPAYSCSNFLPSGEALYLSSAALHEYLGIIGYKILY